MKTTHQLRVLDRELSVVSAASPEKVQAVEEFVNQRLGEIAASLRRSDQQLVLTLALLNISEELLDLKCARDADCALDNRLRAMVDRLQLP